eukprot:4836909-Prymnesium_polylepis.3
MVGDMLYERYGARRRASAARRGAEGASADEIGHRLLRVRGTGGFVSGRGDLVAHFSLEERRRATRR